MNQEILLCDKTESIALLTLNNPAKLNVLSEAMLDALQYQFDALSEDRSVRCIILRGSGKAFCAGHDLREMTAGRQAPDGGNDYFRHIFTKCSKMMMTIQKIQQPVIAEVQGVAVAAGCQLVATCDMAVASNVAKFGVNGVNIGLFCSTPMVALSRNISHKHAFEMLTTGKLIDANRAFAIGLVNDVVDPEFLSITTRKLANLVASKLSAAVKIGKRAFYEQSSMKLEDAYQFAGDVIVDNMMYRDTVEGIGAFLEKRPPEWSQQ